MQTFLNLVTVQSAICYHCHCNIASPPAGLGILPAAEPIYTVPIFSLTGVAPPTLSAAHSAVPLTAAAVTGTGIVSATPVGLDHAVVLPSALPPLTAKVATKIKSGQYVPTKDLLADMSLWNQLPGPHYVCSGLPKPRLREIQSPLMWVSCFLAYIAVRTPDPETRYLLTYARLVVREAQRHGGPGWLEYDKIFRQYAALDSTVEWNELNPSLHASTVMTYRVLAPANAVVCHEPDHDTYACALLGLQTQPPPLPSSRWPGSRPTSLPHHGGPVHNITRPDTLDPHVVEPRPVLFCRLLLPSHLCHLQAERSQGKRLPGDTSTFTVQVCFVICTQTLLCPGGGNN